MKKILSLILVFSMLLCYVNTGIAEAKSYKQTFYDVPPDHWAFQYIAQMVERGVLSGYPDGNFYPELPVTRAEAAKMIAKIEGVDYDDKYNSYEDVADEGEWYSPYVNTVEEYFNSYKVEVKKSNGSKRVNYFYPNMYAEREDIVVALVKQRYSKSFSKVQDKSIFDRYWDFVNITEDKQPYFEKAIEEGIVSGYEDGTVRPHDSLTRAEMATLLCKLYGTVDGSDFVLGYSTVNFNVSFDTFVSRFNQNLEANYDRVKNNDTDNLLGYKRYRLDPDALINTENYKEELSGYTLYSDGDKTMIICNNKGIIESLTIPVEYERYYDDKENRNTVSPGRYVAICAIMASTGLDFDNAFALLNLSVYNDFFSICGNMCIEYDGKTLAIMSKNLLVKEGKSSFGLLVAKNSNSDIPDLNLTLTQFVEKYNNCIYENFKNITDECAYEIPADYIMSKVDFVSGKFSESSNAKKNSAMKLLSASGDLYLYIYGEEIMFVCNTQNEIVFIQTMDSHSCNSYNDEVDAYNLRGICMIMAIEDMSFDEAKAYYFTLKKDKSVTADKGTYSSNSSYDTSFAAMAKGLVQYFGNTAAN